MQRIPFLILTVHLAAAASLGCALKPLNVLLLHPAILADHTLSSGQA